MKRKHCYLCNQPITKSRVEEGADLCWYCHLLYAGILWNTIVAAGATYSQKAPNRIPSDAVEIVNRLHKFIKRIYGEE